jgi:hypothetical protein
MITRILTFEGKIDADEYRFLIGRATVEKEKPKPAAGWMTSKCLTDIQALSLLKAYVGLDDDVSKNL